MTSRNISHKRNQSIFCYGCWNYLDACDCPAECELNFEQWDDNPVSYDDDSKQNNVESDVWYFYFDLNKIGELGGGGGFTWIAGSLLQLPQLWSKIPPQDPSSMLSIPVNAIQGNPWDLDFVHLKPMPEKPPAGPVLAEAAAKCMKKKTKVGKLACMAIQLAKGAFDEYFPTEIQELEPIYMDIPPYIYGGVALPFIPIENLDEINRLIESSVENGDDFPWIDYYMHHNNEDPPESAFTNTKNLTDDYQQIIDGTFQTIKDNDDDDMLGNSTPTVPVTMPTGGPTSVIPTSSQTTQNQINNTYTPVNPVTYQPQPVFNDTGSTPSTQNPTTTINNKLEPTVPSGDYDNSAGTGTSTDMIHPVAACTKADVIYFITGLYNTATYRVKYTPPLFSTGDVILKNYDTTFKPFYIHCTWPATYQVWSAVDVTYQLAASQSQEIQFKDPSGAILEMIEPNTYNWTTRTTISTTSLIVNNNTERTVRIIRPSSAGGTGLIMEIKHISGGNPEMKINSVKTFARSPTTSFPLPTKTRWITPSTTNGTLTHTGWTTVNYKTNALMQGAGGNKIDFPNLNTWNKEGKIFGTLVNDAGATQVFIPVRFKGTDDNTGSIFDKSEIWSVSLGVKNNVNRTGTSTYGHEWNGTGRTGESSRFCCIGVLESP